MRRIVTAAIAVALAITGLFASPALASGTTWLVQAGSAPLGPPIGGGNRFYPATIAIHPGDSVAFTPIGAHTITFNRPPGPIFALLGPAGGTTVNAKTDVVHSGLIGAGPPPQPAFTVSFASTLPAGRYHFICSLHVGMNEDIDVLPMSQALPKTQAQYDAIAQGQIARDLDALADLAAKANKRDEDGPIVLAGAGDKRVSNLRFFPATITVRVGQTVTFLKTKDPTEPHTVTFGTESPDPFIQLLPSGGNTFPNATGTANSGLLVTHRQYRFYQLAGLLPPAVATYKVTFTAAGTYQYICEIHDEVGMVGTVVVR